jgi:GAF domain/SPOR domain
MLGSGELSARLAAATKMLADGASVEPGVATVGRALLFLMNTRHAAIFLRSPTGLVTCPWSHNLSDVYVQDIVTPKDANPWVHILRHPELSCLDLPKTKRQKGSTPWFLPDALALSPQHAQLADRITREGLRSMCAWPLTQAGRVTGALVYYYDSPHVYSQDEQEAMSAFGSQAAAALRDPTTHTPTGSSAALAAETERLAEARPALTPEADQAAEARGSLEAERVRPAETQARLAAAEAQTVQVDAAAAEAPQTRPTARTPDYDVRGTRRSQGPAAFAAERAKITEALEAKTVRLARGREELEAERLQSAEAQARSKAAEVALGRDKEAPAVEEAPNVSPEREERSNAAGPSRWRQATLVAIAIAAVAIAVLAVGPKLHGPAVRTVEHKPAAQVSATAVQKRPVPTPHHAIAAGVVPSVAKAAVPRTTSRAVAKAGVPPTTSRALPPQKATYVVVVGTFESANTAEKVKRLVQSKGYVVHVVRQGKVSKVMTAPMRTRTQAEGVARGLKAFGFRPQLMVSYVAPSNAH